MEWISTNRAVCEYTEQHVFEVQVYLDDLDPEAVRVELTVLMAVPWNESK